MVVVGSITPNPEKSLEKNSPGQVGDPPTGTGIKKLLQADWQFSNRWVNYCNCRAKPINAVFKGKSQSARATAGRFCAGWLKMRENYLRDFAGGGVTLLSKRNIKFFCT
jgi:hypothetical protein